MMSFNLQAFEKAWEAVEEKVDRTVFRKAIDWISAQYIIDSAEYGRGMIEFSDHFAPALTEAGAEPMLYDDYVKALGKYFNAKRNERGFGKAVIPLPTPKLEMPPNRVEEADRNHAKIRATKEVSLTFRAKKQEGKLKGEDVRVDERELHIEFPPPEVTDTEYNYALRMAIAVMNSKRKQR